MNPRKNIPTTSEAIAPDVCVLCFVGEPSPEGAQHGRREVRISPLDLENPTTVSQLADKGIKLRDPIELERMAPWRSIWEAVDRDGNSHGHFVRTVPACGGK